MNDCVCSNCSNRNICKYREAAEDLFKQYVEFKNNVDPMPKGPLELTCSPIICTAKVTSYVGIR